MKRRILTGGMVVILVAILAFIFYSLIFADMETHKTFFKTGGLIGALFGIIGISIAGYFSGKDWDTYTGWERFTHGAGMFYNRELFRKEHTT